MSEKLKHVVLTRPEGRNKNLLKLLANRGIEAKELPMLRIALLDEKQQLVEIKQQLTGVIQPDLEAEYKLDSTFDYALFISANAVEAAAAFCRNYAVDWPAELPCLGMGAASYAAIEAQGWKVLNPGTDASTPESMTSEQLLKQPWSGQLANRRIALVRGERGRELLANVLRQRGALVEAISIYRREAVSYEPAELEARIPIVDDLEQSAVVFASGEAMENFCSVVDGSGIKPLLSKLRCLVPSMRVALEARERGFEKIVVADGASDNAFLRRILALAD